MAKLRKVVIAGRMNVGKSTLFNRLSTDVKSLILDYEGVTRDFMSDVVHWLGTSFELVDTGGVSLRKTQDVILQEVRARVHELLEHEADLILFVCDGKVGITTEDREIARFLHKTGKPVFLVVNKSDVGVFEENSAEFERLGYKQIYPISAQHGTGIDDLLCGIVESLPHKIDVSDEQRPKYRLTLLGRPNVGKSSLMNLLVQQERSLVTDQAGTTREAIGETIAFNKESILVTDTAGVRRRKSVGDEGLEALMVKTSFRAVEGADVVLLLVDTTSVTLVDQDLKLAFYVFEKQHKALIILFNKQDLVSDEERETLKFNLELYEYFLKKIPTLNISCLDKSNVGKIMPLVQEVWQRYSQSFPGEELSLLLKNALERKPLYHKKMPLILHSVRQIASAPPIIMLKVNQPQWFGPSQLGFFENLMRKQYDLKGVPIKWVVRSRSGAS